MFSKLLTVPYECSCDVLQQYWSDVTPLSISESNSSSATFRILFASGSHGDSNPFDGPGGVLAHAFIPQVGNAHFDEAENWTHASYEGMRQTSAALSL